MLLKMRDNLQGWAAKIIVGLIVITMAMFGFGAFDFFTQADPAAAVVNGQKVTQSKLATEVERQRQRIAAQLGNVDPDTLDSAMLRSSVLEGLINRTLLLEAADDMGLAVAESEVDRSIVANPEFQTDGRFDQERFRTLLAGAGHTPVSFRSELANSYRLVQLNGAVSDTPFVTGDEQRAMARILAQSRDLAFLMFDPAEIAATLTIEDDAVEAYYAARPDDFMSEESADIEYVQLSVAQLSEDPSIVVDEGEIEARYEADRAAFAGGEQRRAAHILLEITDTRSEGQAREMLEDAKARIEAGEPFAEVAKAMSEDPGSAPTGGDLGFVNRGAFVPEFENAVWAMNPGDISEPVKTQFGVHLIKLLDVRAETYPPLAEKRNDVIASLRRTKAEELYLDRVRRLDEVVFESTDLKTPASEFGLELNELKGLTRSTGEGVFAEPRVLDAVFSDDVVERGLNSRVVDLGDRAVAVRMIRHRAPQRRDFADVKAEITATIALEQARVEAQSRAAAALERVLAGDGTATIAADLDMNWNVQERVRRGTSEVDAALVNAAFELPRPDLSHRVARTLEMNEGKVAVLMVSGVHDGDFAALTEPEVEAFQRQVTRMVGSLEFNALFESIKAEASITRR